MKTVDRQLGPELARAARAFSALILTGPRRAGKTTLLRGLFPKATYRLLEDPDIIARVKEDPRSFVQGLDTPAILDEIQNVPEILNYIRTAIDASPRKKGQWLLTGSQEAPLMQGVTESMAGRAAIFQLLPFSREESPKVSLFRGGFPEVVERPSQAGNWFRSYLQTYLERDVRAVSSIRDLGTFRRFLSLLATRTGQMLNRTDLAAPLGVSVPTISEWINILEVTSQILLVHPFYENLGKRLVKSPKVYFADSGLACHLLGIESQSALGASPFLGPLFETMVASEIAKAQINRGKRRELYYFRDHQGLEVDFVIPGGGDRLFMLEAKASRTLKPAMADSLLRLRQNATGYKTSLYLVHPDPAEGAFKALKAGVAIAAVSELPEILYGR
jgi:uncharacterized protein